MEVNGKKSSVQLCKGQEFTGKVVKEMAGMGSVCVVVKVETKRNQKLKETKQENQNIHEIS